MRQVPRELLIQQINECLTDFPLDEEAEELLFESARDYLHLYGFKWVRRTSHYIPDFDDLVADTLYRAYKYFHTLEGHNAWTFLAWLTKLARTALAKEFMELKRSRRAMAEVAKNRPLASSEYPPELDLEQRESRDKRVKSIHLVLGTLPSELGQIVEMHHLHRISLMKIADKFGMPLNTVKTKLSRGRKRLRTALTQQGLDFGELFDGAT